ncbi:hypothetical protein GCM10010140_04510 [Streptosporangium pseudovulgare]|uniref:Uncharacterized protein n=2 Tax=Streptosporangium pseudovulgare TaxID=35765 RepID=A0ABQ2QHD9_9ACTN|nr:hypothetical protein GCM10010140_04510 [Streptosporangium pseudovulgare]
MPRVLLLAVLAAGLSACSADGGAAAPPPSPAVSSPATAESTPAGEPSASASAGPTSPDEPSDGPADGSAKPTADSDVAARDDEAGDAEPAIYLLGSLGMNPAQPDTLDVLTGAGDTQSVPLSPQAVVLDQQGRICDKGKVPHRCTVGQLRKALGAHKAVRAKVTLRKGTAVLVEEVTEG